MFKIHDMLDGRSVREIFEKNEKKKAKSTARQLKPPKKVRVHMRIK